MHVYLYAYVYSYNQPWLNLPYDTVQVATQYINMRFSFTPTKQVMDIPYVMSTWMPDVQLQCCCAGCSIVTPIMLNHVLMQMLKVESTQLLFHKVSMRTSPCLAAFCLFIFAQITAAVSTASNVTTTTTPATDKDTTRGSIDLRCGEPTEHQVKHLVTQCVTVCT